MYIRTVTVKTKNGPLEYVQLAHNHRDPVKGTSKTQVLFNFGRADQVDLEAVRRLIKSLAKLLGPDEAAEVYKQLGEEYGFEFLGWRHGSWTACGTGCASIRRSSGCSTNGSIGPRSSGCSSPWWPTAPWTPAAS